MKEQKVQIPIARKSNIFREKIPFSAHHLDHRKLNQKKQYPSLLEWILLKSKISALNFI